ncbi:MAG TPA: hypothetical protein VNA24_06655 [Hyalangium sp.]|nr:hypothetical protein [Hyalangium sp.]
MKGRAGQRLAGANEQDSLGANGARDEPVQRGQGAGRSSVSLSVDVERDREQRGLTLPHPGKVLDLAHLRRQGIEPDPEERAVKLGGHRLRHQQLCRGVHTEEHHGQRVLSLMEQALLDEERRAAR